MTQINLELDAKLKQIRHLKRLDQTEVEVSYRTPTTVINTLSETAKDYLINSRKLCLEALIAYKVGTAGKNNRIAIPIIDADGNVVRINFRAENGELMEVNGSKTKELPEKDGMPILLGTHLATPENGPLYITFGTYDALSLASAGVKNACSVPGGDYNTKFLELQFEWLETFEEIVLWADSFADLTYSSKKKKQQWLNNLISRLGAHRVRIVETDAKDANDLLQTHGIEAVKKAAESAEFYSKSGLVLLADSTSETDFNATVLTGFADLDAYINGLPEKTLAILAGTNSSGKSSVSINFAKGAIKDGKKVFYWPGEQDLDQIKNWADLIFSNDDELEFVVSKKTGNGYTIVRPNKLNDVRSRYRNRFYAFDREEFENSSTMLCGVDDYFQMVDIAIRRYDCKLIILDNLTAIATNEEVLTGADYFQIQAKVVMMCKTLAKKHRVSFVVCAHTKKKLYGTSGDTADDIEGLKRILNLADTVLFVRRYKKEEQREELVGVDTSIEVQKNRGGSKQWDKFLYEFVVRNKTFKSISTYAEAAAEMKDVDPNYIPAIISKNKIIPQPVPTPSPTQIPTSNPTDDDLPRFTEVPIGLPVGSKFYLNGEISEIADADTPF